MVILQYSKKDYNKGTNQTKTVINYWQDQFFLMKPTLQTSFLNKHLDT